MTAPRFRERFEYYKRWKERIATILDAYREWLDWSEIGGLGSVRRINDHLELLRSDRFTIAFVAEFSRGKSELINAMFFAEHGRRLLPTAPGRTTMCPTELLYDHRENRSYVRLLPIETRSLDRTIADLKSDPSRWTTIDLDTGSPEQMQTALRELMRVKTVSTDEAQRLGFSQDNASGGGNGFDDQADRIEIPCWRHAVVSFAHPLLKQGLTVLDTPGLNALGSEPELTVSTLPKAQAVIFVLGADTGVTRSDMEMWVHHVKRINKRGTVVVLNKIDTLWDELADVEAVAANIDNQGRDAARTLGLEMDRVFPISAQKGLVAKIRGDERLLLSSRLLELESFLSDQLMATRRSIVLENLRQDVVRMLRGTQTIVTSHLRAVRKDLRQLTSAAAQSEEQMQRLTEQARADRVKYLKAVNQFEVSRQRLARQLEQMGRASGVTHIDVIISGYRTEMHGRWTTVGLRGTMKMLIDRLRGAMEQMEENWNRTRKLAQFVYEKFEDELGLELPPPRLLSLPNYRQELDKLYTEGEAFRTSPVTTMTEQSFVIRKFFIAIVSRARDIFFRAHRDIQSWGKEVLNPLSEKISEQNLRMEDRVKVLQDVAQSRQRCNARIAELDRKSKEYAGHLKNVRELYTRFDTEFPENSKIGDMSVTADPLTGLHNRDYLVDTAKKYVSNAARYGDSLSMLVLYIDNFKKINDIHSIDVGDKVLAGVGELLMTQIRDGDVAARFAGEALVILLHRCEAGMAAQKAELIRRAVEDLKPQGVDVTASIGVAGLPIQSGLSFDDLFEHTDETAYAAKQAGGNRVAVYEAKSVPEQLDGSTRIVG